VVARGPFAKLGGAVEANPAFDRYARDRVACLSITDGEAPRLYVRTSVTQELLDRLERWAVLCIRRSRTHAFGPEWNVAVLTDGRMCAEVWVRLLNPPRGETE
jgi:hypothetical protein